MDCSNGCSAEYTAEGGSKEVVRTFKSYYNEDAVLQQSLAMRYAIIHPGESLCGLQDPLPLKETYGVKPPDFNVIREYRTLQRDRLIMQKKHSTAAIKLVVVSHAIRMLNVWPFAAKDLIVTPATILKEKPDPNNLVFGTVFTDHMLAVEWSSEFGWEKPQIKPLQNLSLHPGSSALHYAVEVFFVQMNQIKRKNMGVLFGGQGATRPLLFEGLKAFRGVDNKIRLFRPNLNMDRMCRSAVRATLPVFDKEELLECIQQLVKLDQEWVPYSTSASLYIRPTFIGTEAEEAITSDSEERIMIQITFNKIPGCPPQICKLPTDLTFSSVLKDKLTLANAEVNSSYSVKLYSYPKIAIMFHAEEVVQ
ncbi:hypothetical protein P7K49_019479 [Saguinus oedipus]|uniref:Uncharacterized protein n=1 Tax=Saguinus oedipus TaxID=9490 RepID=A0ABQ9UZA0_SAGOE|nr:hypothetical protein P7K49_019479 [Saguinus oedipus]